MTERVSPFVIDSRTVRQVGMPCLYGREDYARGDMAKALPAISGDPNVGIHRTKAITCNKRAVRRDHAPFLHD